MMLTAQQSDGGLSVWNICVISNFYVTEKSPEVVLNTNRNLIFYCAAESLKKKL